MARLGSPIEKHHKNAKEALAQSKRFMVSAKRNLSKGNCAVALRDALVAKGFADWALADASYARPAKRKGPTPMQVKTSDFADKLQYFTHEVVTRCSRGVPKRFSKKRYGTKWDMKVQRWDR